MDNIENCAYCGKKFSLTERIFSKTNGLWICEDCAITQMQENDNKYQQIANLETKLAESEIIIKGGKEEIKDLHRKINEIVERDMNCIQQLKQQLAEERKKVVQEIKDKISDGLYRNSYGETFIDGDIYEILDQIERGE